MCVQCIVLYTMLCVPCVYINHTLITLLTVSPILCIVPRDILNCMEENMARDEGAVVAVRGLL